MLRLQLCERVDDLITAMDMHPTGFYLVTASKTKLSYYNIC
jgi:hypothetical protein